jgi:arylsulfatase A-like enzyme
MVSIMDRNIGHPIEALKTAGVERDTLVVFLSDNGGPDGRGTALRSGSGCQ